MGTNQMQFSQAVNQLDSTRHHSWNICPTNHGHQAFRSMLEGVVQQGRQGHLGLKRKEYLPQHFPARGNADHERGESCQRQQCATRKCHRMILRWLPNSEND